MFLQSLLGVPPQPTASHAVHPRHEPIIGLSMRSKPRVAHVAFLLFGGPHEPQQRLSEPLHLPWTAVTVWDVVQQGPRLFSNGGFSVAGTTA